jgi:transcriptional regulator with XRE-family HTH domain
MARQRDVYAWGKYRQFGRTIWQARYDAHLTISEVAGWVGVRVETLSDWEAGYGIPKFDQAARLADLLRLDLDDLADHLP